LFSNFLVTNLAILKHLDMAQTLTDFMAIAKAKAEKKAKEMAAIELSCWNNNHESELKEWFGFTDKLLLDRKEELSTLVNS
jgi:hypothetical protein